MYTILMGRKRQLLNLLTYNLLQLLHNAPFSPNKNEIGRKDITKQEENTFISRRVYASTCQVTFMKKALKGLCTYMYAITHLYVYGQVNTLYR